MCSPGINGEGELRGQPVNSGSHGKMAVRTECVCVCVCVADILDNLLVSHAFHLNICHIINTAIDQWHVQLKIMHKHSLLIL